VVCASAGNHAQGVAFSCAALGIPGRVFVPATTPRQKRERIRAIGGDAVEICYQHREPTSAVLVPIGGGVLAAGIEGDADNARGPGSRLRFRRTCQTPRQCCTDGKYFDRDT
jgi:threonine dehydratase